MAKKPQPGEAQEIPDLETIGADASEATPAGGFDEVTGTPPETFGTDAPMTQGQFGQMMAALIQGLKGLSMPQESLKEILLEVGKSNAEVARRARWPENPDHEHISVYFTKEDKAKYGGEHNKPTLKRKTYFCGIEEKEERLTVGEILAFNAFETPMECRGGAWRAVIKKPSAVGGKEELWIWVPKETVDQRMVLPSLHLILHELNGGPSTEDVMTLLIKIKKLEALLAAKGATASELEAALMAQA